MLSPERFGEALAGVLAEAKDLGGSISMERVRQIADLPGLTPDQWELVYHYLEIEGIEVVGHEKNAEAAGALAVTRQEDALSEEGSLLKELYLEDLGGIAGLTADEEAELAALMLAGDREAFGRLTEGKLALALRIAETYAGRGIAEPDLIQEANMLLMEALAAYEGGDLDSHIAAKIREGLDALIVDEFEFEGMSEKLAEQANLLLTASNELSEALGRPATMEELAEHLQMEPARVEEIMGMVLDAVNAMEEGKFGAAPSLFSGPEDA